jgi:hypothetical protein
VRVSYGEGSATRTGPESCVVFPRGSRRSVDRGAHRPAIEPRKHPQSERRHGFSHGRQYGPSVMRAKDRFGVVIDTGMCGSSLYGNREISLLAGGVAPCRPAWGRGQTRSPR